MRVQTKLRVAGLIASGLITITSVPLPAGTVPSLLAPTTTIELPGYPIDVAWLTADSLLVASSSGTSKVQLKDKRVSTIDTVAQYPEIVAADGTNVLISGASVNNFVQLSLSPEPSILRKGVVPRFYPRDAAVLDGRVYYLGWRAQPVDDHETRGALWRLNEDDPDLGDPIHEIKGDDDAVTRWRRTSSPYGGAVLAEPGGTIAVVVEAEPGVYRYDANGKLLKIFGADLKELVLDTTKLVANYAAREQMRARYEKMINLQPTIDDLVTTPHGLALVVRVASGDRIGWQLWYVEHGGRTKTVLGPGRPGPLGHIRCETREQQMACIGSFPTPEEAAAGKERPRLQLYDLK